VAWLSFAFSRVALALLSVGGVLAFTSSSSAQNYSGPAPAGARFGCSCLNNETNATINFRWHFANRPMRTASVRPKGRYWICWDYGSGPRTSPPLNFQLDVDMSRGNAWTTYALHRVQSRAQSCSAVGRLGQYGVRYRANTDRQFIEVYKR
jgi:hypothetical protein